MVRISFDPDAGTLYWYFTELIAGSTESEGECAATLLLDGAGQVIGVELELDESITRADLALALDHPQAAYSRRDYLLTVHMADEEPAEAQPLHEPAILDFDADGRLQGCEVLAAPEFGLAERLERLAPFMISLEDESVVPGPLSVADDEERRATDKGLRTADDYRTGFVALVGKPNVGKSTLLNALLGQKVAIVSPKPQTTRMPLRGILTRPDAQIIFVDTPGIHDPRTKLGSFMVEQARRAIPDADVVCFIVDITAPPGRLDQRIAALVQRNRVPRLLVLNKVDLPNPHGQTHLEAYRALGPWDMELAVSSLRAEGLETLLDEIVKRLPPGPPHYPEDQLTDQSIREQAAELVREQVLRYTEQEVPHGVAVEIEEWEEKEQAIYIRMTIYTEKDSQKGILIGASGAMLKRIGSAARRGIEAALSRTIYLDLWVKARPNWRDDPSSLHWLGYNRES
ncbi:MAG TPA: GTPase Era [Roseiflexaceae bacterium]|jgi:GTP-binding protein Era